MGISREKSNADRDIYETSCCSNMKVFMFEITAFYLLHYKT